MFFYNILSYHFQLEASRELNWLKKVKGHFGSVEIASMAQATAINNSGVYQVGDLNYRVAAATADHRCLVLSIYSLTGLIFSKSHILDC